MSDLLEQLGWVDDAEAARLELAGLWARLTQTAHVCQMIGMHEGLYASRREFQVYDRHAVDLWAVRTRLEADPEHFEIDDFEQQLLDDITAAIYVHRDECTRLVACFQRHHAWPDALAPSVRDWCTGGRE